MRIRINKRSGNAFGKTLRLFTLSVGATALGCLLALSLLKGPATALEASAFNGGKSFSAPAESDPLTEPAPRTVRVLGQTFGIRLFTDGVIVTALSDVYTEKGLCCPAADAGLRPGDYVMEADGTAVRDNASLAALIGQSAGETIALTVKRGSRTFSAPVTPVYSGGAFRTGMWVRDSAAGIGTLTFYDPASGRFAGLGHGICDIDAGGVMALKSGEPAPITLCGIVRSEKNAPGQLKGYFSSDESLGTLLANNETGVYGRFNAPPGGPETEVLPRRDVRTGPVQLLVTLDETGPKLYDAEILRVSAGEQATRNLVVQITDHRLLEVTGGIVQGMSGCPILQDGKLAGAVTHVFTEDPSRGYGIFAQTMCEALSRCTDIP